MMVLFALVEPLVIGTIDESLAPKESALASLELNKDKELANALIGIPGMLGMVGAILGLALLGKSLQGGGSAVGTLSSLVFTAVLSVPVISMGLSLTAMNIFADGRVDTAVSLELIGDAVFSGIPLFWGLGYTLLGLGLIMEKGPLPTVLAWLLFLGGLVMVLGTFMGTAGLTFMEAAGFIVFALSALVVVISGVFLLRRAN